MLWYVDPRFHLSAFSSFDRSNTLGITAVLFFRCMDALCSPANGMRGSIKWGLVAHTLAMFTLVTISVAINLYIQSISYTEDRKFPGGAGGVRDPGPLGYQYFIYTKAISVAPNVAFQLNNWLADGLLVRPAFNLAIPCLTKAVVVAPSLLRYSLRELLGYCLPVPDVRRLSGYVLEFPMDRNFAMLN